MPLRAPIVGTALIVLVNGCGRSADEAQVAACQRSQLGQPSSTQVMVLSEGEPGEHGGLASCDTPGAWLASERIHEVLALFPPEARPSQVRARLAPRGVDFRSPSYHLASGELLLDPDHLQELELSIWIHELVHVSMAPITFEGAAGRLNQAYQEAVADYTAAVLLDDPVVGGAAERRDLSSLQQVPRAGWEALAMPDLGFDAQMLGLPLARWLWAESRKDRRSLSIDAMDCARGLSPVSNESIPSFVARLLARCPASNRAVLRRALASWLPSPLFPGSR